jgi:hypothetical protein
MVLLRPTNRLQALLAERGYTINPSLALIWDATRQEYENQHPVVEADYRITENTRVSLAPTLPSASR